MFYIGNHGQFCRKLLLDLFVGYIIWWGFFVSFIMSLTKNKLLNIALCGILEIWLLVRYFLVCLIVFVLVSKHKRDICLQYFSLMIFVTQTSTGTMMKCVPQEQMFVIEATLLENQFLPSSGFALLMSVEDLLIS